MAILREKIHDNRFLRLIENLVEAGFLEDWTFNKTLSGVPQGGVVSPILSNIYLDRLDTFVETMLLPVHNRGIQRKINPAYNRLSSNYQQRLRAGKTQEAQELRRQRQQLPSKAQIDPSFRRLRYVRYADDFLLGFLGPRNEAEEIKNQLAEFLRNDLKLELSEAKTLITHGRTNAARFLGYNVSTLHDDHKRDQRRCRSINGIIGLKAPVEVMRAKCTPYLRHGKPIQRSERLNDSLYSIIMQYQQEYRGIVEYYRLAHNLHRFSRLRWIMEQSLAKTLADKLKISVSKLYERYKTTTQTDRGTYKVLQVTMERGEGKRPLVAQWGGISLARDIDAVLDDQPQHVWNGRTELLERLLADTCELCKSRKKVEVHHVRSLKDLRRKGQVEKTRMGQDDGCTPSKDPCGVPLLPYGYPSWTSHPAG